MLLGKLFTLVRDGLSRDHPVRRLFRAIWFSRAGRILWNKLWSLELLIHERVYGYRFNDILYVNPSKIEYDIIEPYFDPIGDKGKVIGGDWDQRDNLVRLSIDTVVDPSDYKRYHNVEVLQGMYEHFIEGKPWEDTNFYKTSIRRLKAGQHLYGFGAASIEELNAKCREIDYLWNAIKQHGYKSQSELKGYIEDEVSVAIGRNGEILFNNGIHRLSIAKLLRIESIPVRVTVRHKDWVRFKQEILSRSRDGKVYQPLTHPDLKDIPSVYGEERWELIRESLDSKQGTMIDIGAEWGYFCHKFEDLGFNCEAVENNPDNIYFLEKLKRAENRRFKIIKESIFSYADKKKYLEYDVALALNIFHWFMSDEESYNRCIQLLHKLRVAEMFVQVPYKVSESEQRNPYWDCSAEQLVNFILEHSPVLNKFQLIGVVNRRPIYRLWHGK